MNNKKIMFKFTTIISFSIVLMLIFNICMPLSAIADGEEEINIQIDYNNEAGTLNAIGNITSTYTGYELYWVKGEASFNSSSDANEVINWFKTNKIQEDIQNTLTINNTLSITESGTYTVLCIAKINEKISMLKWVSKTITKPQEIENTISINIARLKSDNQTVHLNVTSENTKIKTIKYEISESVINNKDEVKNNGVEISKDANAISVSENQLNAYISMYVEDETGAYKFISKNISQLDSYDSLPWDEEYEEILEEEENKEQNKNEVNQEENKEQNKNEVNQEENKEQNKNEINKEENKEQDKNEVNKEENKEQDKNEVNKEENKEQDKNEVNKEENKEQDKNEVNQEENKEQNKNEINKEENKQENKQENNTEIQKPNNIPELNGNEITIEKLPQTGFSKAPTIIAMLFFTIIGIVSFINYRKVEE